MSDRPSGKSGVPAGVDSSRQVHLDVREDIRDGLEPFAQIMAAVAALGPDQALVLRTPFEPVPLYRVLGARGFGHWTEQRGAGDFSTWFYRETRGTTAMCPPGGPGTARARATTIDVRGLEPPEPMVQVLEAIERLEAGDTLVVIHERRPVFLYPQLEERGFRHETEEVAPGLVRIVIRRDIDGR
jgi:uncharacterized protein (DUF2249 family)